MTNRIGLFLLILVLSACNGNKLEKKEINFSNGKKGEVTFEKIKESENDVVLHLSFTNEEKVIKEATVEKQVEEIWEQTKAIAEKEDIEEALIKYVYLFDFDEDHQKPIYRIILFEADKTRHTDWKIRKVSD